MGTKINQVTIDHTALTSQRPAKDRVDNSRAQTQPKTLETIHNQSLLLHVPEHNTQADHYPDPYSVLYPCILIFYHDSSSFTSIYAI